MKTGMKLLTVSVPAVEFPLVCHHVLKLKLARSPSGPDLLFLNSSSSMPVHFTAGEWQILSLIFFKDVSILLLPTRYPSSPVVPEMFK